MYFTPRTSPKAKAADLFDQVYLDQLTPVQLMRAEGRTRSASVEGRTVRFKRLSPDCKVMPAWMVVWTQTYASQTEATEAARVWKEKVKIMPTGFTEARA